MRDEGGAGARTDTSTPPLTSRSLPQMGHPRMGKLGQQPITNRSPAFGPRNAPADVSSNAAGASFLRPGDTGASASVQQLRDKAGFLSQTDFQHWMHRHHRITRMRVIDALERSRRSVDHKRHRKMLACGRHAHTVVTTNGDAAIAHRPCRLRACPTCSVHHARRISDRITNAIEGIDHIRFLTLTIKATAGPLSDRIDHLIDSYRRLRQTKIWSNTQRGAIGVIECTLNLQSQCYHPHLHIILDGQYVEHQGLKDAWAKATGDSSIVHIQSIPSRTAAAKYLAKYLGKDSNFDRWPPGKILEWINAMHGRRTLLTCGSLHNIQRPEVPKALDIDHRANPAQFGVVHKMHRHGSTIAGEIIDIVNSLGEPWLSMYRLRPSGVIPVSYDDRPPLRKRLATLLMQCDREHDQYLASGRVRPPPKTQTTPPPSLFGDTGTVDHRIGMQ